MKERQTTIADRNEFVDLKLAGKTIAEIAKKLVGRFIVGDTGGGNFVKAAEGIGARRQTETTRADEPVPWCSTLCTVTDQEKAS
jgi:hypothetical protein